MERFSTSISTARAALHKALDTYRAAVRQRPRPKGARRALERMRADIKAREEDIAYIQREANWNAERHAAHAEYVSAYVEGRKARGF